jgi:hypothetical protein
MMQRSRPHLLIQIVGPFSPRLSRYIQPFELAAQPVKARRDRGLTPVRIIGRKERCDRSLGNQRFGLPPPFGKLGDLPHEVGLEIDRKLKLHLRLTIRVRHQGRAQLDAQLPESFG